MYIHSVYMYCGKKLLIVLTHISVHVNELLIRNESESQGGSLTDRVEELLRGKNPFL